MIKGTTRIELTDVHTGKKETVEKENLVTNAVRDLFRPMGFVKKADFFLSKLCPYIENLYGGLIMFDSKLDEDPDVYYPKAGARVTAHAMYNSVNTGSTLSRGSYNVTESERNDKQRYMKFVYDFNTSQGNGRIASVCLTHRHGGLSFYGADKPSTVEGCYMFNPIDEYLLGYHHSSYTGFDSADRMCNYCSVGVWKFIFLVDDKDDTAYYFRIDSNNKITIFKHRAGFHSLSLFENPSRTYPLKETIELPELPVPVQSTNFFSYNYDEMNNRLYFIFGVESPVLPPDAKMHVVRVDIDTWNVREWEMTNTSNENLYFGGPHIYGYGYGDYIYLKPYGNSGYLYKIEIGNSANIIKIQSRDGSIYQESVPTVSMNGRIFFLYGGSGGQTYVLDTETDELRLSEQKCAVSYNFLNQITRIKDDNMTFIVSSHGSSYMGFCYPANYLATINNLTEPVQKTADKTMKVTYILQEQ